MQEGASVVEVKSRDNETLAGRYVLRGGIVKAL